MKKLILISLFLMALASAAYADLRLGLEFGNQGGNIIIRPIPIDIKIGYNFQAAGTPIYLSADYRFIDGYQLIDFIKFALAAGAYISFPLEGEGLVFGVQIPIYLQAVIADTLEIFFEFSPQFSIFPTVAFAEFRWGLGFTVPSPF